MPPMSGGGMSHQLDRKQHTTVKPIKYRVSLGFAKLNVDSLIAFATSIHTLLYGTVGYTNPPVTAVQLKAAIDALSDAKVAQANGGRAATATKNILQGELLDLLQKLAFYVQLACDNSLPMLLESGFDVASTNRTQTVLAKPVITRINPGMSGEALVSVTADPNAKSYELRVAEVGPDNIPGPFQPLVVRTGSRNMAVGELEPGRLCVFQVRAVGGLTGYSDWSDAVVQRTA